MGSTRRRFLNASRRHGATERKEKRKRPFFKPTEKKPRPRVDQQGVKEKTKASRKRNRRGKGDCGGGGAGKERQARKQIKSLTDPKNIVARALRAPADRFLTDEKLKGIKRDQKPTEEGGEGDDQRRLVSRKKLDRSLSRYFFG